MPCSWENASTCTNQIAGENCLEVKMANHQQKASGTAVGVPRAADPAQYVKMIKQSLKHFCKTLKANLDIFGSREEPTAHSCL